MTGTARRHPPARSGAGTELVVLLDEHGNPIGTAPKASVHHAHTPLHRAFSCYAFAADGRLLLTRRAAGKRAFPGCGPTPSADTPRPARATGQPWHAGPARSSPWRRRIEPALPDFRYRAESGGVVENEICPVYLATVDQQPQPDPIEVQQIRWSTWPQFLADLAEHPGRYSPWCRLQAAQLEAGHMVQAYLSPEP